jgi:protein TonB
VNSEVLQAGLPPANDRMLTTCFLAALFHGIVILGVTFSSSRGDAGGTEAPALEVVLVNDRGPEAENPEARYLAQRSRRGAGNTPKGGPTLIPRSSPMAVDRPGTAGGQGLAAAQPGDAAGDDELLSTPAASVRVQYFTAAIATAAAAERPELLEKKPDLDLTPNDEGIELRLRGKSNQQLWVAADTRESDVAVYLDGWRRKIERVGSMNFPDAARRNALAGTPVIEVTIGADGRLQGTVIRRSSGHAEIDAAAVRILKLAAPYAPFPGALRAQHDEIRIAYEWQFLGGVSQGSAVLQPAPHE